MKTYRLNFEGSILDNQRLNLPTYSGIYLVYRGYLAENRTKVHCNEIIYIGQAIDIKKRLLDHEKRSLFLHHLQENEVLFYSYAKVAEEDLDRVENALVFKNQPELNDKLKDAFLYPQTQIISTGQCALVPPDFTVDSII